MLVVPSPEEVASHLSFNACLAKLVCVSTFLLQLSLGDANILHRPDLEMIELVSCIEASILLLYSLEAL